MIIYGLMKFIEQIPERYDRMIGFLTLGGHLRARERMLAQLRPGSRVLDIGCGTGAFLIEAARKGALGWGVDASGPMLRVFKKKLETLPAEERGRITVLQQSAALLDKTFAGQQFDLIASSLALGEMPPIVLETVLRQVPGLLAPGGKVLICDELWPSGKWRSLLYTAILGLTFVPNFVLTRTVIRPVQDLEGKMARAGLTVRGRQDFALGVVSLVEAEKAEMAEGAENAAKAGKPA